MSVARVARQVSTGSEQRFELGISRSCCRNLFGPIDHAQLRAELQSELKRIADEKKRRWNFDFVKAEPLDGDFHWQRIGDNRTVGSSTNEESNGQISDSRITPQQSSNATTHAESNAIRYEKYSISPKELLRNARAIGRKTATKITADYRYFYVILLNVFKFYFFELMS